MRTLRWLKDHWWLALLAIGGVFLLVLRMSLGLKGGEGPGPFEGLKAENRAIDAGRRAREMEIDLGAERAKHEVLAEYAGKREKLDDDAKERIKDMEEGSVEDLARALERATRG